MRIPQRGRADLNGGVLMNDNQELMPCECSRKDCMAWLKSLNLEFPQEPNLIDKSVCCKCSMKGPSSSLNETLQAFRQDIIGDLDIRKDCHEIAKRYARRVEYELGFAAHYADEFLDNAGKALLLKAEKGSARDAYRYADYLEYDFNRDEVEDVEETELIQCYVYWYARSAAKGYHRAVREMGYVASGNYACGSDYFEDEESELPVDDIISDCCFLSAAMKGEPRATERYVNTVLIHTPQVGNEDYVLALQMMGRFANVDDYVEEAERSAHDERQDRSAIGSLHLSLDYGLKESPEMSDKTKWHPWEHPFAVAICAENGWRMKKDLEKALKHYQIAAEFGCKAAVLALKRLKKES